MITLLIHIHNEEPIKGEVEELPKPTDTNLLVKNPRKKDDKTLIYLDEGVDKVIWPLTRIAFIEVMPSRDEEHIIGFVRE
jgi:hypothetical protein